MEKIGDRQLVIRLQPGRDGDAGSEQGTDARAFITEIELTRL